MLKIIKTKIILMSGLKISLLEIWNFKMKTFCMKITHRKETTLNTMNILLIWKITLIQLMKIIKSTNKKKKRKI